MPEGDASPPAVVRPVSKEPCIVDFRDVLTCSTNATNEAREESKSCPLSVMEPLELKAEVAPDDRRPASICKRDDLPAF